MKFSFEAEIYKAGINPCVKVPARISARLTATKGYIPIRGTINGHAFQQTLVPVKNEDYRLYVNGPMLKGAAAKLSDTAKFTIEQDHSPRSLETYPLPKELKKVLSENKLMPAFKQLTPSRQKEVLRYLGALKTKEALWKNIDKLINGLKKAGTNK
jgi:hypothetical protein